MCEVKDIITGEKKRGEYRRIWGVYECVDPDNQPPFRLDGDHPLLLPWNPNFGNSDDPWPGWPTLPPSPIILDLDADGVGSDVRVLFDHAGDGFAEATHWAEDDDAVLVWDRDGDGVINDGSELFGSNTVLSSGRKAKHGFEALAEFDSNRDGKVDAADENWDKLQVLQYDPQANEGKGGYSLASLSDVGVKSISTRFVASDEVDAHGNEHRQVGSYTDSSGVQRKAVDVWFATSPHLTVYDASGIPEHGADISALPEVIGSGLVYNLRDAMALDRAGKLRPQHYGAQRTESRKLHELVKAFVEEKDQGSREVLLDRILLRWSGAEAAKVSDYWTGGYFAWTEPSKMAVVEAFLGVQYQAGSGYRHPGYEAAQTANSMHFRIREYAYSSLISQSVYRKYLPHIRLTVGDRTTGLDKPVALSAEDVKKASFDMSALQTALAGDSGVDVNDLMRVLASLVAGSPDITRIFVKGMADTAPQLSYTFSYHLEYLMRASFDGNDRMADEYSKVERNREEVFRTVDSGIDTLYGGRKGDVYQLGEGTGHDVIEENFRGRNREGSGTDTIRVQPGVKPERVRVSREGNHLRVSLLGEGGSSSDSFLVHSHFADEASKVERVEFEDGTVWGSEVLDTAPLRTGPGTHLSDHFHPVNAQGGQMQGAEGGDVYWLGAGSGHAVIDEGGNDGADFPDHSTWLIPELHKVYNVG